MTVWRLTKGTRTLRCEIENHPLGQEVRLYEGDEFRRSEVVRTHSEVTLRPGERVAGRQRPSALNEQPEGSQPRKAASAMAVEAAQLGRG